VGFLFLLFGTFLIFWAQKTSLNLKKEDIKKETFLHGPYCYTRSPTHYGLFLLILGFGIVSNSFFVIVFSIISFFITKIVFLKKEE
jgi:protein-S-isoprenylcysteine O-methyltransferase Ste14